MHCVRGCRCFVQLIRLVWYFGIIDYSGFIKDNALRCVCLLPVLFWLFYLVTALFPGFGSGMYGVSLAQLHLCALHARPFFGLALHLCLAARGPCLVCWCLAFPPCTHSTRIRQSRGVAHSSVGSKIYFVQYLPFLSTVNGNLCTTIGCHAFEEASALRNAFAIFEKT